MPINLLDLVESNMTHRLTVASSDGIGRFGEFSSDAKNLSVFFIMNRATKTPKNFYRITNMETVSDECQCPRCLKGGQRRRNKKWKKMLGETK